MEKGRLQYFSSLEAPIVYDFSKKIDSTTKDGVLSESRRYSLIKQLTKLDRYQGQRWLEETGSDSY